MRFLLDENADVRLVPFLVDQGHDVTAIVRDYPTALSDDAVLAVAVNERRVIITRDTDFGELIYRESRRHEGVILLRLRPRSLFYLQAKLSQAIERLDDRHRFIVVTDQRIRVR
jgi:predicted nuclease of predicted toxin-antitoxin system